MIQQLAHNISYLDQSSKAMIVDFKNKDYSRNQDSFREAAKTKIFFSGPATKRGRGGVKTGQLRKNTFFWNLFLATKKIRWPLSSRGGRWVVTKQITCFAASLSKKQKSYNLEKPKLRFGWSTPHTCWNWGCWKFCCWGWNCCCCCWNWGRRWGGGRRLPFCPSLSNKNRHFLTVLFLRNRY